MSIAIVGKLFGGLVVSSSGIAAITYMVINSPSYVELGDKDSGKNIYIYAISKKVVDAVDADESSDEKITEYKCKFNQKDYQCIVSKVADLDSTTKQAYVDDPNIIDPKGTNKEIVASELKKAGTIYKILIKFEMKDWTKDKDQFSIEIIKDKTTTYASLKPLFAIKSGGLSYEYTETEYFVVKKNEVSSASAGVTVGEAAKTTTFSHKCETSNTASGETIAAAANNCNVYDFSNNADLNNKTLHTLVFTKPGTATTDTSFSTTTANKHYLVKLNEPVKVSEVQQIKIKLSTGSEVSFTKDKITPAIYTTEKENGIFILEKNTKQESS